MVIDITLKKDYSEIKFLYKKSEIEYYKLSIILYSVGESYVCLSHVYDRIPTDVDKVNLYSEYLGQCKSQKLKQIVDYDNSSEVNSFYINGLSVWLDKATRVGLANSIAIEQRNGKNKTILFLNGMEITVPIEQAIAILDQIELYALDCYRQTESHKVQVMRLQDINEVENYDYTLGYPEKLEFLITTNI